MKYTPLDNIGLPSYDVNGNLTSILTPGNNYPANELGIPKSKLVSTRNNNIILTGKFEENEATYPLLNPIEANIVPITGTSFRFIINIKSGKSYTSESMYNDLIKAYEERNPWFSIVNVPNITLDLVYLTQYNLLNKFKVTEAYCETEIIQTIDDVENICRYIDWLVSKDEADIDLKPISELGSWEYKPDGSLGIGVKPFYESMIKEKNPDPEAIGADIIRENYSLDLPDVTQVSGFLQPLPPEEIVPKLVEAILSERVPPGKKTYSFFGGGVFGTIAAVVVGAAVTLLTGGLAGLAIGAVVAGLSQQGIAQIQRAFGKFKGSWLEFILARSSNRGLFEAKDKVYKREAEADTKEWNGLLIAAKGQMGITRYGKNEVNQALQIIFSQLGGDIRASDLSYKLEVGGGSTRMQVVPQSANSVKIILK